MAYEYDGMDWEEVDDGDDTWDVLCTDQDVPAENSRPGAIEFTIDIPGTSKRQVRVVTKEEREEAAQVHRAHVLCLAARALLFDAAADDPTTQATLLSLQPSTITMSPLDTAEVQRAVNGLRPLLSWFRDTFALAPLPALELDALLAPVMGVQEQVQLAAQAQAGSAEVLAALFAALVRVQGGNARVARLLDAAPLRPWRAKPVSLKMQTQTVGMRQKARSGGGGGTPGAAGASAVAGGEGVSAVGQEAGPAKGKTKGKGSKKAAAAEGGEDEAQGMQGKATGSKGKGKAKGKKASSAGQEDAAAARSHELGPGPESKLNRGDDELERQLQAAMQATAAAAEAAALRVEAAATLPGGTAGPGGRRGKGARVADKHTMRKRLQELIQGQASGKRGGAAGIPTSHLSLPGAVLSSREGVVATVWAEVYCGTVDAGRWVHVDVVNGYIDQPGMVDGASARKAPLCYVVACEHGRIRDVTQRYAASMPTVLRNRDDEWWQAVTAMLHAQLLPGAPSGSGRTTAVAVAGTSSGPLQLAAEKEEEVVIIDSDDGDGPSPSLQPQPSSLAGTSPQLKQEQGGDLAGISDPGANTSASLGAVLTAKPVSAFAAASRKGACIIDARYSHQRGTQDNPMGMHASAPAVLSGHAGGGLAGSETLQAACSNGVAVSGSADAMRAAREEAELSYRALSQLHGLPASIDGFKTHPLYVLKRHVTKYEALKPGTLPLGLHKGEPYYPRAAVSVLHTTERWRREGRTVLPQELPTPMKEVKKRKQPPPNRKDNMLPAFKRFKQPAAAAVGGSTGPDADAAGDDITDAGGLDDDDDDEGLKAAGTSTAAASSIEQPITKLYGFWQTEAWEAPVAVDGIVPKNERGNVEVPPLAQALPVGTVHVNFPGLGAICRGLSIDYAPGLVGFEVSGGRMVPKIEGVVVCEEFSELLVCAYLEREAARAHAEAAREAREAQAAWRALIRATLTRARVHAAYGGEHQGAAVTSTHLAEEGSTPAGGKGPRKVSAHAAAVAAAQAQLQAEYGEAMPAADGDDDAYAAAADVEEF